MDPNSNLKKRNSAAKQDYFPCWVSIVRVFLEVRLVIQVGGLSNHELAKQNLNGNPLFSRVYISLDVLAQF